MVSIQLLCVGKLKEKHFTAACEEYQKRLSAFCKLTVTELPEVRLPENPSQAQIDGALEKEGAAILAKLPKGGKLVALCVEGDLLSSPALAQQIQTMNDHHYTGYLVQEVADEHYFSDPYAADRRNLRVLERFVEDD